MSVIFVVTTTSASPIGVEPPASPVPEPRGTTGSPCRAATRTPLAFYALSVAEAVGTTYEGTDRDPVYRRWRSS
jgi:hypothetical protein